jgi:hypothetical protein
MKVVNLLDDRYLVFDLNASKSVVDLMQDLFTLKSRTSAVNLSYDEIPEGNQSRSFKVTIGTKVIKP